MTSPHPIVLYLDENEDIDTSPSIEEIPSSSSLPRNFKKKRRSRISEISSRSFQVVVPKIKALQDVYRQSRVVKVKHWKKVKPSRLWMDDFNNFEVSETGKQEILEWKRDTGGLEETAEDTNMGIHVGSKTKEVSECRSLKVSLSGGDDARAEEKEAGEKGFQLKPLSAVAGNLARPPADGDTEAFLPETKKTVRKVVSEENRIAEILTRMSRDTSDGIQNHNGKNLTGKKLQESHRDPKLHKSTNTVTSKLRKSKKDALAKYPTNPVTLECKDLLPHDSSKHPPPFHDGQTDSEEVTPGTNSEGLNSRNEVEPNELSLSNCSEVDSENEWPSRAQDMANTPTFAVKSSGVLDHPMDLELKAKALVFDLNELPDGLQAETMEDLVSVGSEAKKQSLLDMNLTPPVSPLESTQVMGACETETMSSVGGIMADLNQSYSVHGQGGKMVEISNHETTARNYSNVGKGLHATNASTAALQPDKWVKVYIPLYREPEVVSTCWDVAPTSNRANDARSSAVQEMIRPQINMVGLPGCGQSVWDASSCAPNMYPSSHTARPGKTPYINVPKRKRQRASLKPSSNVHIAPQM